MNRLPLLAALLLLSCGQVPADSEPSSQAVLPLQSDQYVIEATTNLKSGPVARHEDGLVNVVVEIPAGTTDK